MTRASGHMAAASADTPVFELNGVGVRFGGKAALQGVHLTVAAGDLAVILGPDGAGKSTLLRVLAGLQAPHEGARRTSVSAAELGYAGASFDLYGDLTVAENLDFFGRLRGMTRAEVEEGIGRMLALTGLGEARDRLGDRLSGGMKKKLSLAAALIHRPRAVLLDEPTVGVDPVSRRELWDILAEANAWGTAVVYTSPYLDEAARARRILLLRQASLLELDAGELLQRVAAWRAWIAEAPADRRPLRGRLARLGLGPRVYLRPEGLAVLARDETEAKDWAARVTAGETGEGAQVGPLALGPTALEPRPLSLDDAFVLLDEVGA